MKKTARFIIKKNNTIGLFFFFVAIVFKGFGDAIIIKDNPYSPFNYFKYIFLILATIAFFLQNVHKKNELFKKEFITLCSCYFFVGLISLWFSFCSGKFVFRTIKEFIFILVPIVFVYSAINVLNTNEIVMMAKISEIVFLVSYFIEMGKAFSISVAVDSIRHFSLAGGQASWLYDALESSAFPDPMMALFCFFTYYQKQNKKWQIVAYIGILLMNKRLIILAATAILLADYLPITKELLHQKFSKKGMYIVPAIIFTLTPLIIMLLTEPVVELKIYELTGINMLDFWMGRDTFLQNTLIQGYKSYGLGSTFDFNQQLFEIESVKFYLETTIVGVALISFSYWKITNANIFSMIVMLYIFLNMNTSTSIITGAFAWIYYLFLIGEVNINAQVSEHYSTSL